MDDAHPRDADILREVSRGNLERFDAFVDRYKTRLYRAILSRVGDRHLAEDLAQEVFLRAFRAGREGAFAGDSTAATWLFAIASNCVIDHLRRMRRRPETFIEEAPAPPDPAAATDKTDPARPIILAENSRRAFELLRRLPDEQREVVELKVFGELTFREIAEVVGCSTATAKSRMRYGLMKIRNLLPADAEDIP